MILYHFSTSPFARRVRLALALKGLSAELRDPRANPAFVPELRACSPMHTVPVLIDGARTVVDSNAIAHYLDRLQPAPALFPPGPGGALAFELAALADGVIGLIADLGGRYHALHDHPRFSEVRAQLIGRAQRSLELIEQKVLARGNGIPLCGSEWSWADIVVFTLVTWLEGLPIRAATQPVPAQMVSLGWTLPPLLSGWADQHRARPDVVQLG